MIKAIIFDCFGVLTTDLWKEFVATLPDPQVQPARDLSHAYNAGTIEYEEFTRSMRELTGRQPQEVEKLLSSETTKNEELLRYIAELKKDYKIGMVSNIATNWVRESFLTPEEQKLFDTYVFSFESGTTKPDPRMFELAAERLQEAPEACVMIDDVEHYVEAAKRVGMQGIVYENFAQCKRELEQILAS